MKTRFFAIALLLVAATNISAKTRTLQQIKTEAMKVLNGTAAKGMKKVRSAADLSVLMEKPQLTILTSTTGSVVVANDDAFAPILGYTDAPMGDNIAPAFLWWVETANQSLENMLASGMTSAKVKPNAAYRSAVNELLTCRWGQNAPFNNICPEYTDKGQKQRYVTGCVATAMSQILYYHKYPITGDGKYSYRFNPGDGAVLTLKAEFGKTTYDWDNMLDVYTEGKYNEAQAQAVATIMSHCGISVKMNYNKDGSGAYPVDATLALRKYFRCNKYAKMYMRNFMPNEEWMNIIYRELNDNCPILYGGTSAAGGHAFVLDGYNKDGLVHVNWGWDGKDNGFFDIASLNGYTSGQTLTQVRPATDTRYESVYKSIWGTETNLTLDKVGESAVSTGNVVMYNLDVEDFTGTVAFVATNMSTGNVKILSTFLSKSEVVESTHGFQAESIDISLSSLGTGKYRLHFASKGATETSWQPVRSHESVCNCYIVSITNGKITSLVPEESSNWTGIQNINVSTTKPNDTRVYSIDGRVMGNDINAMGKGLYIVDGKKVMK
ncbi:C10 family peptidase [uncultured Prevotella sp.]|uniref:C10 family peptidase n=1 Tax=uncultured Prevotella sp. TaxID=159272 RepID=UPI0025EB28C5|nr:C10 family peptidase [uncultured Prevotella sp.]